MAKVLCIIKYFELFAGIGGFSYGIQKGFSNTGHKATHRQKTSEDISGLVSGDKFDFIQRTISCVGYSEIDKYADAIFQYHHKGVKNYGSITDLNVRGLPDFDLLTFGSPCQDFSIAGKRAGLDGQRSSLIGRAIEIIKIKKPRFFIWENVKGTFSSNNGADFWAIIKAFTDIGGYRLEWQLLNTSWFLPQNRERIYLIGHLGERGGREVFPIGENGQIIAGTQRAASGSGGRVRGDNSQNITANAITKRYGKDGSQNLIQVGNVDQQGNNSLWGRVYSPDGDATTLTDGGGLGAKTGLYKIVSRPHGYNKGGEKDLPCLRSSSMEQNEFVLLPGERIRRLTPVECERLQGFPDGYTEYGLFDGVKTKISDTQRYKCLGNAVTTHVVAEVVRRLYG